MLQEMHSFPLEKQIKIVITPITLNFIKLTLEWIWNLNFMMTIKGY